MYIVKDIYINDNRDLLFIFIYYVRENNCNWPTIRGKIVLKFLISNFLI